MDDVQQDFNALQQDYDHQELQLQQNSHLLEKKNAFVFKVKQMLKDTRVSLFPSPIPLFFVAHLDLIKKYSVSKSNKQEFKKTKEKNQQHITLVTSTINERDKSNPQEGHGATKMDALRNTPTY